MGIILLGVWLICFSIVSLTLRHWLGIFGLITGTVLVLEGLGAFQSITFPWIKR